MGFKLCILYQLYILNVWCNKCFPNGKVVYVGFKNATCLLANRIYLYSNENIFKWSLTSLEMQGRACVIRAWRPVTAHHSHLPQRPSLRSWVPGVVFAMLSIDATGGWQVAAGRGGPWRCCNYCCETITPLPPRRSLA